MNVVYLIGIALALVFTVFGIIVNIGINPGQSPMFTFSFTPDSLWHFFDLSSILIVVGGTLAVVIACYVGGVRRTAGLYKHCPFHGRWH